MVKVLFVLVTLGVVTSSYGASLSGTMIDSTGFFQSSTGLRVYTSKSKFFACRNFSLFAPTFSSLSLALPGLQSFSSPTCNTLSLGTGATAGTCKWVTQTFLGMLYDRGVELSRHNIPQADAFQVFEHARLVLLQYQACNAFNKDGTANIPIAVESLYGYVLAKLFAKHSSIWTPRAEVDEDAEPEISSVRSKAVSALLDQPFPLSLELSPNSLQAFRPEVYVSGLNVDTFRMLVKNSNVAKTATALDAVRSASDPTSTEDCNNGSQEGTWEYLPNAFTPMSSNYQKCCAAACNALLTTIGVSPTALMQNTCCSSCNKFNCAPATSQSSAAVALMTVVAVPSLLNAYVTTVTLNV